MLPVAEHIIALDSSGTILAQGKLSQVQAHIPKFAAANRPVNEAPKFQTYEASPPTFSGNRDHGQIGNEYVAATTGGTKALKYYFDLASWPAWAGFYGSLAIVVCMNTLMSEIIVTSQPSEC
jgi:hypothetical protein